MIKAKKKKEKRFDHVIICRVSSVTALLSAACVICDTIVIYSIIIIITYIKNYIKNTIKTV